jgi:tetratricopeptide (TPR) repeat protein
MSLVRRPFRRSLLLAVVAGAMVAACTPGTDERLAELRSLQLNGRYAETIEPLREILKQDPSKAEASYLLGVSLLQTGRPAEAVFPLRKATESEGYAVEAGILLASALISAQAFDEAAHAADQVIEKDPQRFTAWAVRAQAHLAANQFEAAIEDADQLSKLKPDEVGGALVRATALVRLDRIDEAETTYTTVLERARASGDLGLAARACVEHLQLIQSKVRDSARAEKKVSECVAEFPTDPSVLQAATEVYTALGRPAEATRLWREATEKAPESIPVRFGLSWDLERRGLNDEAEQVLVGLTQDFSSSIEPWKALADFQRRQNAPGRALDSIDKALAIDSQDARLRFERGDLLAQQGRLDEAEAVVATLPEGPQRDMLNGSILLQRHRYAEALDAYGRGLARWPENLGAHLAAGQAAERMGNRDRAIAEYRAALRLDTQNPDARVALGRIALAAGSPDEAADLLGPVARSDSRSAVHAEALRLLAQARQQSGDPNGARAAALQLRALPGHEAAGWVALAELERKTKGPAAARTSLESCKLDLTDPANVEVLRALVQVQLDTGARPQALALVARAVAAHPDDAGLRDVEGRTLLVTGQLEPARAAFERAQSIDASFAPALAGLATVEAAQGHTARAIELYDQALILNPLDGATAYQAAQLVLMSGQVDEAEKRLRAIVDAHPDQIGAANDLAWILADRGVELDLALRLAEHAVEADPKADNLDTLGYVHLKRAEYERAGQALRRAQERGATQPGTSYRLGLALKGSGQRDAARTAFEKALGAGAFPERGATESELAALSANP